MADIQALAAETNGSASAGATEGDGAVAAPDGAAAAQGEELQGAAAVEAMLAEREAREMAELLAEREAREKAQIEKEMTKKIAMAQEKHETWCYIVEYRDPQNGMLRKYKLNFFMADSSLELIDIKRDSVLFKREVYPSVTARDLQLGNTIVVYKRDLLICNYGDESTAQRMEKSVDTDIERFKKPLQTRPNGDELYYMWDADLPDDVKEAIETAAAEKRAAAGIEDEHEMKSEEELAREAEMAALEAEFKDFDFRVRSLKITDIPDELNQAELLRPAFEKLGRVLFCGVAQVVGDETWGIVTLSTAEAVAEAKDKPPVMIGESDIFVLRLHEITEEFAEVAAASAGAQGHILAFGMANAQTQKNVDAFGELYTRGKQEAEAAILILMGKDPFADSEEEEVFLEPGEEPEDWEQLKRDEDFTTPNVLAVITHTLDVSGVEEMAVGPLDQTCFEPPTSKSEGGGLTNVTTLGSPRDSEDGESIWSALNDEGPGSPVNKSMSSRSASPLGFGAQFKLQAVAAEEVEKSKAMAVEEDAAKAKAAEMIESGAAVLSRVCERLDGLEISLLQIFQKYDKDSTGTLDATELRQGLRELGIPIRKDEATKIVRQIDKDGDGSLSISEFLKKMLEERNRRHGLTAGSVGAKVDAERALADQLLFWCVLGDVDRVEKTISKGAGINAVDEVFGDTPLIKAVINCHKDVVALLLRCEASISVANRAGETALPIAERDSTPEIARMLRAHAEALAAGLAKAPVAWADRGEELWFWASEGGVEMGDGLDYAMSNSLACAEVTKLLDAGINVDARDAETNETALMIAASCGAAGVVELLLGRGADPREIDSYGANALHRAADAGHGEVVDMLTASQKLEREKLKLVEARDRVGVTAAEKAMRAGYDAIAQRLLALGVQASSPRVGPRSPTAEPRSPTDRKTFEQLQL